MAPYRRQRWGRGSRRALPGRTQAIWTPNASACQLQRRYLWVHLLLADWIAPSSEPLSIHIRDSLGLPATFTPNTGSDFV